MTHQALLSATGGAVFGLLGLGAVAALLETPLARSIDDLRSSFRDRASERLRPYAFAQSDGSGPRLQHFECCSSRIHRFGSQVAAVSKSGILPRLQLYILLFERS